MIFTCRKCENDFLTEADLHVVIPTNIGSALECGCRYRKEITKLKKALEVAEKVINLACHIRTYNEADIVEEYAHEAQKQIKEIMEVK